MEGWKWRSLTLAGVGVLNLRDEFPWLPADVRAVALVIESKSFDDWIPAGGRVMPHAAEPLGSLSIVEMDDVAFPDSPAAGDLFCTCSRCGRWMDNGERVFRLPFLDGSREFRFCRSCVRPAA